MTWTNLLVLLVVLACPISMMWMMRRRGHDHNNSAGTRDVDRMDATGGRTRHQSPDSATEFSPQTGRDFPDAPTAASEIGSGVAAIGSPPSR